MKKKIVRVGLNRKIEEYGPHIFYFSYDTLIGYSGPIGNFRTEKKYSQTTSKHMSQFRINSFLQTSQDHLDTIYSNITTWKTP